MTRAELTEKILGIKREKGWNWRHICDEIGGMSPILITGAMLGQMKLTKPQAAKAAELLGLDRSEQALLNECRIAVRRCRQPIRSSIASTNW
jgi:cyanate lyase